VRKATIFFFDGLAAGAWSYSGTLNGKPLTVRALAFIAAGPLPAAHEHPARTLRRRVDVAASKPASVTMTAVPAATGQPSSRPRVIWLLPVLSAVYAVWAGRDANWDLLNNHYYMPSPCCTAAGRWTSPLARCRPHRRLLDGWRSRSDSKRGACTCGPSRIIAPADKVTLLRRGDVLFLKKFEKRGYRIYS
jgi:hypothetical protein